MSKRKPEQELNNKSVAPSAGQEMMPEETESSVFYRCTCPECGEDALELCGLGVFYRSEFLGVTDGDEIGCGYMELDGDYNWAIVCRSCEHSFFDTQEVTLENLLEWASTHGKAVRRLESGFVCPVCGSQALERIERGNRSVRAVYEISDNSETEAHAEVALSFEQVLEGGNSVRYCCWKKHELTNQDGSPVQTDEELVAWLKAHQPSVER
ncbi:MAG: hypothetical protein WBG50_00490 [Desulfomonilaceae bacterium]